MNEAARAESGASDTPILTTWEGQHYRLVPTSQWDLEVLEAMEDGKISHILRGILADDGYARLLAAKPKMHEIEAFMTKALKALGISGN